MMFKPLRIVPAETKFDFLSMRLICFVLSLFLIAGSIFSLTTQKLNFGIDFVGGTLIEIRTNEPADIASMRQELGSLGLGEVSLQQFGSETDILIRIQQQDGGEKEQAAAVEKAKTSLGADVEYRRVEYVGPQVGEELIKAGLWAVLLALTGILIYVWLRFEWQYGLAAVVALVHDVITTLGLFSILGLEFNLATVAAVLTVAGYSINDTVVIFDRVREQLRRYKKMPLNELLNLAINTTLSRTIMTSVTTLIALIALFVFGGEIIRGFTIALIWGVIIGTYSTMFVAVPLLLNFNIKRSTVEDVNAAPSGHNAHA